MGHMNIMWYVGKFDEANWNLFARLGLTPAYLREKQRGMAAVQQTISYKRELRAGDVVEVRSRIVAVGESSLRFVHEMRDAANGDIASVCEFVAVHIDQTLRRACSLPHDVRQAGRGELAALGGMADQKAQQSKS
jgi:acyl-CoA thioester hydrolase